MFASTAGAYHVVIHNVYLTSLKNLFKDKHSSLFCRGISNEEKSFVTLQPGHRGHQVRGPVLRRNVGPKSDLDGEQVGRRSCPAGRALPGSAHFVQPDQSSSFANDAYQYQGNC